MSKPGNPKDLAYSRAYYASHKAKHKASTTKRRQAYRLSCLTHYSNGTLACACCGERTYEFLGIDHMNGNGNKHRREIGGPATMYLWLIRNEFPEGFRVMCHNCNMAVGFYGTCPHQRLAVSNGAG